MMCEDWLYVRHVYKFRHLKHANWQLVLKSSSKQTFCRQRSKSNKSIAKCDECASLEICPENKNPTNFPGLTNVDHSDKCPNQVTSHSQHLWSLIQDKFKAEFKFEDILNFWMRPEYYLMSARVSELGSLSSGAKMATKIFVNRVFTIFCVKCVVFARNRKFAKLTQWNMQYISCNSALLAQETLFLTQKGTFFAQRSPKSA